MLLKVPQVQWWSPDWQWQQTVQFCHYNRDFSSHYGTNKYDYELWDYNL